MAQILDRPKSYQRISNDLNPLQMGQQTSRDEENIAEVKAMVTQLLCQVRSNASAVVGTGMMLESD